MEPCRFFAKGRCAFGSACRFAHVTQTRPSPPSGIEARGGSGASSGARAPPPSEPPPPPPGPGEGGCTVAAAAAPSRSLGRGAGAEQPRGGRVCRYFLNGGCAFGDSCRNLHQLEEAQGSVYSAPSGATAGPPPGFGFAAGAGQGHEAPLKLEQQRYGTLELEDAECGICFESIAKKGERFGMLEHCDHAFCLSCIRSWRKQREQQDRNNLRLCPICRNESFFVIPGDTLLLDPKAKGEVIDQYKKEMLKIPCKLFDYGKGKCPFGTSCFYAHLNPDGTRFRPAPLRWMSGADGNQVMGEVKLSDFFH